MKRKIVEVHWAVGRELKTNKLSLGLIKLEELPPGYEAPDKPFPFPFGEAKWPEQSQNVESPPIPQSSAVTPTVPVAHVADGNRNGQQQSTTTEIAALNFVLEQSQSGPPETFLSHE